MSVYGDLCHRRLRSWAMNTMANATEPSITAMRRTPWCDRFEIVSKPMSTSAKILWWSLPDPFDPSFKAEIDRQLLARGDDLQDPWCIGFFVDNELQFQRWIPSVGGKEKAEAGLDLYFRGIEPDFIPKLGLRTTAFRKAVWSILLTIPYGQTMTYRQIASLVAEHMNLPRMSAQAVGGAVGHNPISLIIPCHRVVGADGSLTGYAGGTDKKLLLLRLEHADPDRFHFP